jgi:hypothetical protein
VSVPGVRRTIVRSQDLLVAELGFHNLKLDASGTRLHRTGAGEPIVVIDLPPQHIAEEVFPLEAELLEREEHPTARSRIAGSSRLAFRIPATVGAVPLELGPLLTLLATCELRVVDAALPRADDPTPPGCLPGLLPGLSGLFGGPTPALRVPEADETSLELPFRLVLSPPGIAGFVHRPTPVTGDAGRVELWHSQLGVAPGLLGPVDAAARSVRAVWLRTGDDEAHVWSPDQPTPTPPEDDDPFRTTLSHNARHQIVHLSSNFRARHANPSVAIHPRAIEVRRLALTSLGATLDVQGEWAPPAGMSLAEWVHRAALGRDHFVRLVHAGWLFPFGHRARHVLIYERRFHDGAARAALIRVRSFVVVREPLRRFKPATAPTLQRGRTMPLRRVEVRTLITPDLRSPVNLRSFEIEPAAGGSILFHLQGADDDDGGNIVDFRTPLWFVRQDAVAADVDAAVNGFGERAIALDGDGSNVGGGVPLDIVAVDPGEKPAGDSTWRVRSIRWRGDRVVPPPGDGPQPPFHPRAPSVDLRLPAVEVVAGSAATTTVAFHPRYVEHGLEPGQNPGAVVASMAKVPLSFVGKGDRSGGLVRPELDLTGLSRTLGPVAGPRLDDIASGAFNPSDFFAGALPKLFGTLELDRLLKATGLLDGLTPRAPKLGTLVGGTVTMHWEPQLRDYPEPPKAIFVTKPGSRLELRVTAPARAEPGADAEIRCTLEKFAIRLVPDFECVEIHFAKAEFVTKAGKPDVDVRLEPKGVRFIGALSFVETLTKIIPIDGFSDPPSLNVTPSGADARFSLSLPSLTLGIFSLENVSFGAGFLVPFDQRAMTVGFHFCERHEPFLLTVSALGGGGFFLIEVDARGVERLEAALEFGASLSMDFGVASGGVHVMAGIHFAYESSRGAALTGYFRVGGYVTALGIISVSIELCLSLAYEAASGKAVGVATLTIEIEVFLFSASVEIRCERKFAGSASDPSFEEVMRPYLDTEDGVGAPPAGLEVPAGEWPFERYWAAYA